MNTTYQKPKFFLKKLKKIPRVASLSTQTSREKKPWTHASSHQENGFWLDLYFGIFSQLFGSFLLQLPLLQPQHQEVPKVNIQLPGVDPQDPGQTMSSPKLWKMFGIEG